MRFQNHDKTQGKSKNKKRSENELKMKNGGEGNRRDEMGEKRHKSPYLGPKTRQMALKWGKMAHLGHPGREAEMLTLGFPQKNEVQMENEFKGKFEFKPI